jgi:hypothetical protein
MVNAATSPYASGAILRASSTAPWQAGSPVALRFNPPIPYTPANPTKPPITTVAIARGIRRVLAAAGVGNSGISFVILYQLRLCRAYATPGLGVKPSAQPVGDQMAGHE